MRSIFKIIGGAALAFGILSGVYVAVNAVKASRLEASSRSYVESNLPLILASWSVETLQSHAAPQLLKAMNERPGRLETIREGFDHLSKLGIYQRLSGVQGRTFIFTAGGQTVISASYEATAHFENGAARIRVRLIQDAGAWRILEFATDPPIFVHETT